MRDLPALLLCGFLVLGLALPVHAEEDDPGAKPAPSAKEKPAEPIVVPKYGAENMICQPTDLPEGWSACPKEQKLPEGAPTEDMLMMLGVTVGYDEDSLFVESRAIRKGEATAVVSIVDVDASPTNFHKALTAKAETGKWHVAELGTPMRLLVVSAADEATTKTLASWQREIAVHRLVETGWAKLKARSLNAFDEMKVLVGGAQKIEPRAGVIASLQGFLLSRQSPMRALESWRYAVKKDTPIQPRGKMRVETVFQGANAMLVAEGQGALEKSVYPEIAAMLEDAIKHEKSLDLKTEQEAFWAFGNRYNLACTYARMGKIDEGLKVLKASMLFGKKHLPEGYENAYRHMVHTDSDMDPFKEDERYKKLVEDVKPGADD